MNTKHTPGPWIVHAKGISGAYQITPHGPTSMRICTVTNAHNDEANARLIAAAPDLLEALEACLAFWDKPRPTFGCNAERATELKIAQDKARAAIHKAQGGAS